MHAVKKSEEILHWPMKTWALKNIIQLSGKYLSRFGLFQMKSTKVDMVGTERALLGFLLAKIHKIDPDIIVVSRSVSSSTCYFVISINDVFIFHDVQ